MLMKPNPSLDSGNQSCYRLCGSVKDVTYCKNLLEKANERSERMKKIICVTALTAPLTSQSANDSLRFVFRCAF